MCFNKPNDEPHNLVGKNLRTHCKLNAQINETLIKEQQMNHKRSMEMSGRNWKKKGGAMSQMSSRSKSTFPKTGY